jgi:hypothetical protein
MTLSEMVKAFVNIAGGRQAMMRGLGEMVENVSIIAP